MFTKNIFTVITAPPTPAPQPTIVQLPPTPAPPTPAPPPTPQQISPPVPVPTPQPAVAVAQQFIHTMRPVPPLLATTPSGQRTIISTEQNIQPVQQQVLTISNIF